MASPEPRPLDTPPVLAWFLLGAGLACSAGGVWLARFDLAGFVERQIVRAHGSLSTETSAWLRSAHFSGALLVAGLVLAALGAIAYRLRPSLRTALEKMPAGPAGLRGAALACLVVFAWYFPTLRSGYFRYDDFEFLGVAQDGFLWPALWQPHGDHILPLTRVLAFLGLKFFGVTAWPYNLCLLLCLCGVLLTGLLLLGEMGVAWPGQWVFTVLVTFWSPWGEIMSGYYILSIFLMIAGLGLGAAWFYLRWRRTGRAGAAIGLAGCALLAPLIDVSGGYVFGICGVFLALDLLGRAPGSGFRSWLHQHRYLLAGLAVGLVATAAWLFYAYRVANPGVFPGLAGEASRTLPQVARDLAYLLNAGVLLTMATPFVYARLPVGLLGGLVVIAAVAWLAFFVPSLRAATRARRRMLGAVLLVVLGTGLMVTLGRPPADTWIVRWAAKHIAPVYIWLCLLGAAGWDALWLKMAAPRRLLLAEFTAVGLAGFVTTQCAFGLLGLAVAFPPFGYPAEIRDAGRRRTAVEGLRDQVVGTMISRLGVGAVVPVLDGNYLKVSCPSLFSYNLSHYLPFFAGPARGLDYVRNPAMQSWHTAAVRTVPVLRDAVSPSFLRLVVDDPVLRAFYFAGVPLETQAMPALRSKGGFVVTSDGSTAVMLQAGAWDPETQPRLSLAALDRSAAPASPVTVIFWSDLLQAEWRGTALLQSAPGRMTEVDLRQVYAFALSRHVANLRVILPEPGRYWLQLAEVTP